MNEPTKGPCPGGHTCCNRDEFSRTLFPCKTVPVQSATHPDDDPTPVDEDWLRAVGFGEENEWCREWRLTGPDLGRSVVVSLRYFSVDPVELWVGDQKVLPGVPTRGTVRTLARVLGITLTEADPVTTPTLTDRSAAFRAGRR